MSTFKKLRRWSLDPTDVYYQTLEQDIIQPLIDLGYRFEGTISTKNESESSGVHLLHFENPGYDVEPIPEHILREIETWDEGTMSSYKEYFGTLIIQIIWSA